MGQCGQELALPSLQVLGITLIALFQRGCLMWSARGLLPRLTEAIGTCILKCAGCLKSERGTESPKTPLLEIWQHSVGSSMVFCEALAKSRCFSQVCFMVLWFDMELVRSSREFCRSCLASKSYHVLDVLSPGAFSIFSVCFCRSSAPLLSLRRQGWRRRFGGRYVDE